MSYTQNIIHQAECNYINPMLSNAREMLNPCINLPNHKPNYEVNLESNLCNGRPIDDIHHKSYNIDTDRDAEIVQNFSNTQNAENIKRRAKLLKHQTNLIEYLNNKNKNSKPYNNIIEGFTTGSFVSDDGPGEKYIEKGNCPIEYEYSNISNMCEKKVEHGNANIDYDSDYSDVCYPNNYDGINNDGNVMCSKEINTDGARMLLSTKITDQNSMDEIIKNNIR